MVDTSNPTNLGALSSDDAFQPPPIASSDDKVRMGATAVGMGATMERMGAAMERMGT